MAARQSAPARTRLGCAPCSTQPTALPSLVSAGAQGPAQPVLTPFTICCSCCRGHSSASLRPEDSQYSCFSHHTPEHNAVPKLHSCCPCAEQLLPQFQQHQLCPKPQLLCSQLHAAAHRTDTCWGASSCQPCPAARARLFPSRKQQPQLREHQCARREGEFRHTVG